MTAFSSKPPWNPSQIAWICLLFGALPSVGLWVVNGRRLGLIMPPMTRVFVGVSLAIYVLIVARLFGSPFGSPAELRFRFLSFIMTGIIAWQLFLSQRAAFARHRGEGGAMASVWTPILTGIVGVVMLGSMAVGMELMRATRDYREFDRAVALMSQKPAKMRQAEVLFKNFVKNQPDEPMAHWNLAVIYNRDGRIKQAQTELRALLKLEPSHKEARDFLKELESIE